MRRKNNILFTAKLMLALFFILGVQVGFLLGTSNQIIKPVVVEAADSTTEKTITITRKNGKKSVKPQEIIKEDGDDVLTKFELPAITKVIEQMRIGYNEEIDNVIIKKEESEVVSVMAPVVEESKPEVVETPVPVVEEEKEEEGDVLGETITVPDYCGTFKAYMSYRAITNENSTQYKLQQNENMWTDKEGMERYNNDYVVAVGKYFADKVGDRLLVHMKNGTEFTVIVGDFKASQHTDAQNMYNPGNNSIIEFLVDTKVLNKQVKKMGDASYLPTVDMSGKVEYIQKITNVNEDIAALYK